MRCSLSFPHSPAFVLISLTLGRFKPLHSNIMHERISYICDKEGLICQQPDLETLSRVSAGESPQGGSQACKRH